jgi:hypothetical protein
VKFRIGDLCLRPLSIYEFRDNWFSEINRSFKDIKIWPDFLNFYPTGKSLAQEVFGNRARIVGSLQVEVHSC